MGRSTSAAPESAALAVSFNDPSPKVKSTPRDSSLVTIEACSTADSSEPASIGILDLGRGGEDVLVAGEAALDQPAVDHGPLGADQNGGVALDRQVDRGVVVVEVPLDQLQGLDRHDGLSGRGDRAPLGLGRGAHAGEASGRRCRPG